MRITRLFYLQRPVILFVVCFIIRIFISVYSWLPITSFVAYISFDLQRILSFYLWYPYHFISIVSSFYLQGFVILFLGSPPSFSQHPITSSGTSPLVFSFCFFICCQASLQFNKQRPCDFIRSVSPFYSCHLLCLVILFVASHFFGFGFTRS